MRFGYAPMAPLLRSLVESPPAGCGLPSVSRSRLQIQIARIRSGVASHASPQEVATQGAPFLGRRSADEEAQGKDHRDGHTARTAPGLGVQKEQILCGEDLRDLQQKVCQRKDAVQACEDGAQQDQALYMQCLRQEDGPQGEFNSKYSTY